jgi:hypothetical protein
MKKYRIILSFLALVALISFAQISKAEDGKGPWGGNKDDRKAMAVGFKEDRAEFRMKLAADREAFVTKLRTDRAAFLAELKTKKEEWKGKAKDMKEEWRGRAQEMLSNRFDVAVTNLERIQGRVENLIEGVSDADVKSAATDFLNTSKDNLGDAKEKIEQIKKLIPDSGEKITADTFEQIKTLARDAKDLLKESHNNLVQAIKEIKGTGDDQNKDEEKGDNDSDND